MVKNGVLPKEAILLTAKLTKGSDIQFPSNDSDMAFNFDLREDSSRFPQTKAERPLIMLSQAVIKDQMRLIETVCNSTRITLSQEQIQTAALYAVACHEWGHSLEKALSTQALTIIKSLSEFDKEEDYWSSRSLAREIVEDNIRQYSIPLVAGLDEQYQSAVHIERFATTFQIKGLLFGLQQSGVSVEDVQKIQNGFETKMSLWNKQLVEFKNQLGFDSREISWFAFDVQDLLRNNDQNYWIIPTFWTTAGYNGTYTDSQITQAVSDSLAQLNPNTLKEKLIASRKV